MNTNNFTSNGLVYVVSKQTKEEIATKIECYGCVFLDDRESGCMADDDVPECREPNSRIFRNIKVDRTEKIKQIFDEKI